MDGFLGEIKMFAGSYAPANWAFCWGQMLAINDYNALYAVLGTTYGGDGRNTFALPDMRGRAPVGAGTGPGLTSRISGQMSGQERVSLTVNDIPAHSHGVSGLTATVECNNVSGEEAAPAGLQFGIAVDNSYNETTPAGTMAPGNVAFGGQVDPEGGSISHSNMQPWMGINYIICLMGMYPPRN